MADEMIIEVAEDDADPERLDTLTGDLLHQIRELEVDDVRRASGGPAPAGSRSFDPAAVGALLVTVGGAATSINDIVIVLRGWLGRGPGRTVKVQIGGDCLELSNVSKAQQAELVDLFVRRHGG